MEVIHVKQHYPAFCEFEPVETTCQTLAEVLELPFIREWREDPAVDHLVQTAYGNSILLMAIMGDRKHWVVAYLHTEEPLDLPQWERIV